MKESIGQNIEVWDTDWEGLSPLKEIRMWDYFGLRHWISKYVPRKGKVLEAGCGMGRFVFYLSNFGIDIEGVDFSPKIVNDLNNWQNNNGYNLKFDVQDVTNLKYIDNELSGYISLGVVEHFIEGPQIPLKEAFRVLRPGGIAIVTTPSYSFNTLYRDLKKIIYRLLHFKFKDADNKFYQYWYRPHILKKLLSESGFYVSRYSGSDLLFAFFELFGYKKNKIDYGTFAYRFSSLFESTFLNCFGAQSVTVSVKVADLMNCFFCGRMNAGIESLKNYDVPLCCDCTELDIAKLYRKNSKVYYSSKYLMNPDIIEPHGELCEFCGNTYTTNEIFEDFGFNRRVCNVCLMMDNINIELSANNIKPVWRLRT